MAKSEIGQQLLKERKRRKLTRESVAIDLGTAPSSVRGWEKGFNAPNDHYRAKIQKWLDAEPAAR